MPQSPSELEAQVAVLVETVRKLEGRVAELERGGAAEARRAGAPRPGADTAARARSDALALASTAPLVGRTLLVLAGAFVLRALTDAGTLPAWLGVVLGLAYAGTWLALSDRAAGARAPTSAAFHAFSAVVIGFPLLFEAGTRLRLLGPLAAAALLAALTAGALRVAARRRLEGLAWIAALGGAATAVALAASSGRAAPAALYLVLLGAATLWLGYVLDWFALRWPVALLADGVVLVLALGAGRGRSPDSAAAALVVLGALVAAYLGSIATRTLLLGRSVVPFEVAQAIAAIALGLGGAAHVTARAGMGAAPVGVVSIAFGAAAYAVAFAFLERQKGRANFYFYTSAAIAFVLGGGVLLLPWSALGLACAALAVGAGALGPDQRPPHAGRARGALRPGGVDRERAARPRHRRAPGRARGARRGGLAAGDPRARRRRGDRLADRGRAAADGCLGSRRAAPAGDGVCLVRGGHRLRAAGAAGGRR